MSASHLAVTILPSLATYTVLLFPRCSILLRNIDHDFERRNERAARE